MTRTDGSDSMTSTADAGGKNGVALNSISLRREIRELMCKSALIIVE